MSRMLVCVRATRFGPLGPSTAAMRTWKALTSVKEVTTSLVVTADRMLPSISSITSTSVVSTVCLRRLACTFLLPLHSSSIISSSSHARLADEAILNDSFSESAAAALRRCFLPAFIFSRNFFIAMRHDSRIPTPFSPSRASTA